MGMPRAFVGFSSTDLHYYQLMCAWKEHEHIDFNFTDCQLANEINSESENYIKFKCRSRIQMVSKYVMLIGEDTRYKHKYVRWEAEVAIEKGCIIIGVNLNRLTGFDEDRCPPVIRDIGAVFVPFSPKIIAHAIDDWVMRPKGNWFYKPEVYRQLGYNI